MLLCGSGGNRVADVFVCVVVVLLGVGNGGAGGCCERNEVQRPEFDHPCGLLCQRVYCKRVIVVNE